MIRLAVVAAIVTLRLAAAGTAAADPDEEPVIRSQSSGPWSSKETWDLGRLPRAGDRVLVRGGDTVVYDVDSPEVLRLLQVAGTLDFARDRDTRLEAGLIKIIGNEDLTEEGFDCHMPLVAPAEGEPQPCLQVGTIDEPIPREHKALVRLHYVEGMNRDSCPAIICCGGRMDFHGAPLPHPWMKLSHRVRAGDQSLWLAESPEGWREGDRVVVTRTHRRLEALKNLSDEPLENEERKIVAQGQRAWPDQKSAADSASKLVVPTGAREASSYGFSLHLDEPLDFDHEVQDVYRGEVANLSRNVIVESADPDGVRGHTMYHKGSAGSISYAEFRHLGKKGLLGRYPIHFHLVEDSMRGSFVKGASIWGSDNRWIVIHGANYLVVSDCVGYDGIGHGYFLENGCETFNVLDHNLAVLAKEGQPLPEQALPFDQNLGAGFWWANCHNVFSNNVAVDCDEYGFRFEVKRTPNFDPMLPLLQADGRTKRVDVRSLPFISFTNNEAHSQRSGGLNVRGISRPRSMIYEKLNKELTREARESTPDQRYPFWIHNFRAWDCSWAFHSGTGGVFLDGFDAYADDYAIWRSVMDRSVWRNTSIHGILNKDLHMPFSVGLPDGDDATQLAYLAAIQGFVDDFPPVTAITQVVRRGDQIVVRGTSADSTTIQRVLVNDRPAVATRENFIEWEAVLAGSGEKPLVVSAHAEDAYGNVESRPHRRNFD